MPRKGLERGALRVNPGGDLSRVFMWSEAWIYSSFVLSKVPQDARAMKKLELVRYERKKSDSWEEVMT